jgi:hypothetical protein
VKVPELDPAPIVSKLGPESTLPIIDTAIVAPPIGALFVKVTVHVLELFGTRLEGLQEMPEIVAGATRLIDALTELLPYLAVMTADWSIGMAVVVTVKLTEPAPAVTVTEPGTANAALLLVSITAIPPLGAALLSTTVHIADVLGPKLVGLQEREATRTGATKRRVVLTELVPTVAVRVAL